MSTEPSAKAAFRFGVFRNWLSLAGVVIALASLFSFILLMTMDYFAKEESPYLGILTYVVSPMFFVLGLFLIGVGWLVHHRQRARVSPGLSLTRFAIDLSRPRDRWRLFFFLIGSGVFLLVSSVGSYQTYHVTKSVMSCVQACHGVM